MTTHVGGLVHDTIQLEQQVSAGLQQVWRAFADSEARAQWGVPAGDEQVYDRDDFRTGGEAAYRCGDPGLLQYSVEVNYAAVDPRGVLVYTETVWSGDDLLATALVSWELTLVGDATVVAVTDQVTSFVGPGMVEGHRNGHRKALKQLAELLTA